MKSRASWKVEAIGDLSQTKTGKIEKQKPQTAIPEKNKKPKPASEIDDIFAVKKKKEVPANEKQVKAETKKPSKKPEKDDFFDSRGKGASKKVDGLRVYQLGDLNIGKGGDTELCPFDCECCF